MLVNAGSELADRLLGPREQSRVGAVLLLTAEETQKRFENGEKVRSDDFFEKRKDGYSKADEVAESAFLKAQKEAEEKKLKFISHFLSECAFNEEISAESAHQMLKIVEALSYRQLKLLQICAIAPGLNLPSGRIGTPEVGPEMVNVFHELFDLQRRGLFSTGETPLGISWIDLSKIKVGGLGASIYRHFKLDRIPVDESTELLERVLEKLKK